MNTNEKPDSFKDETEKEITIHTFSTIDPTAKLGLRRDDNEELNKLREEIEQYIADLLSKLSDSIGGIGGIGAVGAMGGEGGKGDKGDKGDTGPLGPRGLSGSCEDTYTAGNGIDITNGVISVVPSDFLEICL
jgi:hypothetical protein